MIDHQEDATPKENSSGENKKQDQNKEEIKGWNQVVVAILILAALIGGFYWGKSSAIRNVEVKEVIGDLTAEWDVYESEKYGFSFKYPVGWEVKDLTGDEESEDPNIEYILREKDNSDSEQSIRIRIFEKRSVDARNPEDAIQISLPFDKKNYLIFSTSTGNEEKEIFYNIAATLLLN